MLQKGYQGERMVTAFSLTHPDQHPPSISIGGTFNSQNLIPHSTELVSLQGVREEVCDHVVSRHVLDDNFTLLYTVTNEKELDVNVAGPLVEGPLVLH